MQENPGFKDPTDFHHKKQKGERERDRRSKLIKKKKSEKRPYLVQKSEKKCKIMLI